MSFQELLRSWTSKGILLVLVVAFAAWGISDVLRTGGPGQNDIAMVGEEAISAQQLQNEFRHDLQRLQSRNPSLTSEQAQQQRLYIQSLLRLVGQSLVRQEALRLGVTVSDEQVRAEVLRQSAFQNEDGKFDKALYDRQLRNSNLNPARYEDLVRGDLTRAQLLGTVAAARPAPKALAEAFYRVRQERRSAQSAIVPRDDALDLPEPTEVLLETFHKENAAQFTAPEYRTVTLLRLAPEALTGTIELSEEDLQAEYESRANEFKLPETRSIEQVLAKDEATTKEGVALLGQGQSFAQMTAALTAKGATANVLADVTKDRLPTPVADIVFGLERDKPSEPIETAFGFSLYRVTEIKAAHTRTYEEARDDIKAEMSLRLAADSLVRLSKTIEDELASSANVDQAASAVGVDVVTLTLDSAGFDKAGNEVLAGLADRNDIVVAIFELEKDADTGLRTSQIDSAFVARLNAIEPSALRPLAEVRDKVLATFKLTERLKRAELAAAGLAATVKTGTPLSEAAKAAGYEVVELDGMVRNQPSELRGSTPVVERALFAQDPAAPTPIVELIPEGYAVVMLKSRETPDPASAAADIERMAEGLGQARDEDIAIAFQATLEQQIGVNVNQARLESLFSPQSNQ